MEERYIHGYSEKEQNRLIYQNDVLSPYIYERIDFTNCKRLMEVGCGVGAQMLKVLHAYPEIHVTGVDISATQLDKAKNLLEINDISPDRYHLVLTDITKIKPFELGTFDAINMVWVLEHVPNPQALLSAACDQLESGGRIAVTEVFHNSFHTYPHLETTMTIWKRMIEVQNELGGDANVGIRLCNLFSQCNLRSFEIKPYLKYFDRNHADKKQRQFVYWSGLIESAIPQLMHEGDFDLSLWQKAQDEMAKAAGDPESVFYYSFIQGFGIK